MYKRDALGHIVYWAICSDGLYDKVTHGVLGSKTEPEATLRLHTKTSYSSEVKRKRDRGYKFAKDYGIDDTQYESVNQLYDLLDTKIPKYLTDANNVDKPMKCQKFRRGVFDYSNGALADPKINGVRCTIRLDEVDNGLFGKTHEVVIRSKEGLRYNVKHIEETFAKYVYSYHEYKDIVFDGELYIYGQKNTSIGGAARNPLNPLHKYLQFVNFDLSIPDMSNRDRFHLRREILKLAAINAGTIGFEETEEFSKPIHVQYNPAEHYLARKGIIVSLCSTNIRNDDDVEAYRDVCIDQGYEGCVVRSKVAEYQFGSRPLTMMKAKKCEEAEFLCIDIKIDSITKEVNGKTITNEYAKFVCRNDLNDEIFEVKPTSVYNGIKDETMESPYILSHKSEFIGKMLAVKFYERTDKKIPFNANAFGVRDYENID
ncbi:MAG: hypothetical protein HDQ88_04765 [Clostridia bacterium]|nr:hypothetical protein [Clostridia bacterium]